MFEEMTAPKNVAAFRVTGTMSGEDVDKYQRLLHEKLEEHGQIGLCMDMTGLSDLDAEAFTKGVKADVDFLKHLDQVGRLAVVSDKQWPHILIGLYNRLLSGVEAKVFTTAEREQALAWSAEVTKRTAKGAAAAFRTFATTEPNVLGFEMNGTIGREDLEPVMGEINAFLEKNESVRLLNRVRHFGFNPSIFFQSGLMSMKLAAMKKVERYAIVGAPAWIEKAVGVMNPLFPDIDMRTFPADAEATAWDWIGAEPQG